MRVGKQNKSKTMCTNQVPNRFRCSCLSLPSFALSAFHLSRMCYIIFVLHYPFFILDSVFQLLRKKTLFRKVIIANGFFFFLSFSFRSTNQCNISNFTICYFSYIGKSTRRWWWNDDTDARLFPLSKKRKKKNPSRIQNCDVIQ